MHRRFLPVLLVAVGISAAAPSCLSPTLPLPPPDQPDSISEGLTSDTWNVSGSCLPGARVVVMNDTTGVGVVYEDRDKRGAYQVNLLGARCDTAYLFEELGQGDTERASDVVYFVLAPYSTLDPMGDSGCP